MRGISNRDRPLVMIRVPWSIVSSTGGFVARGPVVGGEKRQNGVGFDGGVDVGVEVGGG